MRSPLLRCLAVTFAAVLLSGAAAAGPSATCGAGGVGLVLQIDGLAITLRADGGIDAILSAAGAAAPARADSFVLEPADPTTVIAGRDIKRCPATGRCTTLERLPFEVRGLVPDARGAWYAAGGSAAGLYRAKRVVPGTPALVVGAEVLALCRGGLEQDPWAVVSRAGELRLVVLATGSPAVSFLTVSDVLLAAAHAGTTPEVWARLVTVMRARAPAGLGKLAALAARDARAEVRALAAEVLAAGSGRAVAGLWLLAHDAEPEVREAAFAGVERRCRNAFVPACEGLLTMFTDDPDPDVAWTARDLLLMRAPRAALLDAPRRYKLDAIAMLTMRLERDGYDSVQEVVGVLAADADPEVRLAARVLTGVFEP